MASILKNKSEFTQNVLTLMTGTVIAQAIPIAISPILTRIYTPEDFGLFALFFAILSIFSVVMNARYENAIMLPKKDEDAINIFALAFLINLLISLFLFLIVLIFNEDITHILGDKRISLWLYFIPISLFFVGLFNILNIFNNRKKNYKDIAQSLWLKSLIMAIIQLGLGFIKDGATGLISGQIISQFFANMRLSANIWRDKKLIYSINKIKIIALAKKYSNFPKFSLPSALSNVLSGHLANILISSFFSVATLGYYSLVQRVLGIPSVLIGRSMGQVYYEEGVKEKNRTGKTSKVFMATLKKLLIVGIPSFILLFFTVERLFIIVFGEEWAVAGEYAQLVVPMFFFRFIVTSLSSTYDIFQKLKIEMIWQLVLLIGTVLIVVFFHLIDIDFKILLIALSFFISIMQLVSLYIMKKISDKGK